MIDINILKCELAKATYLFTGKMNWGIDCDIDELLCKINSLYNYISIIENAAKCPVSSTVWNDIRTCEQQIQAVPAASLCRGC